AFIKSGRGLSGRVKLDGPIPLSTTSDENADSPGSQDYIRLLRDGESLLPVGSTAKDPPALPSYKVHLNTQVNMLSIANAESPSSSDSDDVFRHTVRSAPPGVYRLCFYNDVSKWSSKAVDLDLLTGVLGASNHVPPLPQHDPTLVSPSSAVGGDVDESLKLLKMIKTQLRNIDERQSHAKHRLDIHIGTNRESHGRLTVGSIL
ncbi:hypothetical protein TrRE_jg1444, partial [Triparma retinervis]